MSQRDNLMVPDSFKKEFLTEMFDIMYHGEKAQDEGAWTEIYHYEANNVFSEILCFINDIKSTGRILTEASLVDFIIFAESEHIGNNHLIGKGFSREETERFEKLAGKLIAATKG